MLILTTSDTVGVKPLLNQPRERHPAGGDDRQRVTRAREAAEALFAPKRAVPKTLAAESLPPVSPPASKPRVLPVSKPSVPTEKSEPETAPASSMIQAISAPQVPRIRTWLKFGMKLRQVAQLIGVDAKEIEHMLRTR